ncbi:MAG: Ig-like domain-containing protein, partial [bacterium]
MRTSLKKHLWVPIIVSLACGGGDLASPSSIISEGASHILSSAQIVASVAVTLPSTLDVGDSTIATVVASDASGQVVSGHPVTWSTRDPAIAIITNQGVVSGISVGSVIIDAAVDGVTGSATIDVAPVTSQQQSLTATVGSIVVSLGQYTATAVGQTTTATAVVTSTTGTVMTGIAITWTSNNERIVTVNGLGNVTARSFGLGTVTGTVGTVSNTVPYTIAPPSLAPVATVALSTNTNPLATGGTSQSTATLRDSVGALLTGRLVTWSSSDSAVATVSAAGLIQGTSAGTATITAVSEGQVGTLPLTVVPTSIASVVVTTPSTTLQAPNTM